MLIQWVDDFKIGDPVETLFKPRFELRADDPHGRMRLYLRVRAPDADGKRGYITVTVSEILDPSPSEPRTLHNLMRKMLHTLLLHEADESIYIYGRKVFDPHMCHDLRRPT